MSGAEAVAAAGQESEARHVPCLRIAFEALGERVEVDLAGVQVGRLREVVLAAACAAAQLARLRLALDLDVLDGDAEAAGRRRVAVERALEGARQILDRLRGLGGAGSP